MNSIGKPTVTYRVLIPFCLLLRNNAYAMQRVREVELVNYAFELRVVERGICEGAGVGLRDTSCRA